ncbi:hypothetical protein AB6A40_008319 [Gnathostoma spinigerum]|uniref:Uncharacterized protein n=1 Tax=Gnathostoma spinigerum TaxID=75299 RepID=A0ABD6EQ05_9BILA
MHTSQGDQPPSMRFLYVPIKEAADVPPPYASGTDLIVGISYILIAAFMLVPSVLTIYVLIARKGVASKRFRKIMLINAFSSCTYIIVNGTAGLLSIFPQHHSSIVAKISGAVGVFVVILINGLVSVTAVFRVAYFFRESDVSRCSIVQRFLFHRRGMQVLLYFTIFVALLEGVILLTPWCSLHYNYVLYAWQYDNSSLTAVVVKVDLCFSLIAIVVSLVVNIYIAFLVYRKMRHSIGLRYNDIIVQIFVESLSVSTIHWLTNVLWHYAFDIFPAEKYFTIGIMIFSAVDRGIIGLLYIIFNRALRCQVLKTMLCVDSDNPHNVAWIR